MMGPRAIQNQKKYLQQALQERKEEKEEKEEEHHKTNNNGHGNGHDHGKTILYESTTAAAQKYAFTKLNEMNKIKDHNLNTNQKEEMDTTMISYQKVQEEQDKNDDPAITFWSHHFLMKGKQDSSCHNDFSGGCDSNHTSSTSSSSCNTNNNNMRSTLTTNMKQASFAKCTTFTNDLRDGRLKHASY